jgi:hypothetical protein
MKDGRGLRKIGWISAGALPRTLMCTPSLSCNALTVAPARPMIMPIWLSGMGMVSTREPVELVAAPTTASAEATSPGADAPPPPRSRSRRRLSTMERMTARAAATVCGAPASVTRRSDSPGAISSARCTCTEQPVRAWMSRTFSPPLPMMKPTSVVGTSSTSEPPGPASTCTEPGTRAAPSADASGAPKPPP